MPKKSEIECPLRKLREITGKSQVAFARVLGCSPSTIKKIEAGDNSKLNRQLILAAAVVFSVSPESLVPPSTQPTQLHGERYTKEFFEEWWKTAPERVRSIIQHLKSGMLRDFEMILAAVMRAPGMSFGGVQVSFYCWAADTIINFHLLPHY
jgi:transcriptional regulator with XRE-family HTH domain